MNAKRLLMVYVCLSANTAMAGDPWSDDTLVVADHEAHVEAVEELLDVRKAVLKRRLSLLQNGVKGGTAQAQWETAAKYFRTASRVSWLRGDFEGSYRSAEHALLALQLQVEARQQIVRAGIGPSSHLDRLEEALELQTQWKLVLLRYQSEAQRRGIQVEPTSIEDMQLAIEKNFEALLMDKQSDDS